MQTRRLTWGGMLVAAALVFAGNVHAFVVVVPGPSSGIDPLVVGNSYAETGDAGDASSPQDVVGTDISQITGDIGIGFVIVPICPGPFCNIDPTLTIPIFPFDTIDAYRFHFSGGDIEFIGVVHPGVFSCVPFCNNPNGFTAPAFAPGDEALPLSLFSASNPSAALDPTVTTTPSWHIEFNDLAAGNYIIQATYLLVDPPYDITIITEGVVSAVPEPATLALLGLGLAGLGFSRRKQ